jgi:hypothetical protein
MAWATIGLFILTFTPVPFAIVPPSPAQQQQQQPQQPQDPSQSTPGISVMLRLPSGQLDYLRPASHSSGYTLTQAVDLQRLSR